jgi:hypothetical protein
MHSSFSASAWYQSLLSMPSPPTNHTRYIAVLGAVEDSAQADALSAVLRGFCESLVANRCEQDYVLLAAADGEPHVAPAAASDAESENSAAPTAPAACSLSSPLLSSLTGWDGAGLVFSPTPLPAAAAAALPKFDVVEFGCSLLHARMCLAYTRNIVAVVLVGGDQATAGQLAMVQDKPLLLPLAFTGGFAATLSAGDEGLRKTLAPMFTNKDASPSAKALADEARAALNGVLE